MRRAFFCFRLGIVAEYLGSPQHFNDQVVWAAHASSLRSPSTEEARREKSGSTIRPCLTHVVAGIKAAVHDALAVDDLEAPKARGVTAGVHDREDTLSHAAIATCNADDELTQPENRPKPRKPVDMLRRCCGAGLERDCYFPKLGDSSEIVGTQDLDYAPIRQYSKFAGGAAHVLLKLNTQIEARPMMA